MRAGLIVTCPDCGQKDGFDGCGCRCISCGHALDNGECPACNCEECGGKGVVLCRSCRGNGYTGREWNWKCDDCVRGLVPCESCRPGDWERLEGAR